MISPVSEVGKNMLSSLQGAMAKGMPVDQAIQYVKSQAATGVAPLVDLYALLKQFERLKQPPAQNVQGGNLREQLNNLESSIVGGGRGLAGLGGPTSYYQEMQNPMQDPMSRGLGAIDAGAMENPQGFNSGGIVAFVEGGNTEDAKAKSITPELYKLPTSLEDLARQAAMEEAKLKTPEGRAAFLAQRDAEMKEAGLGKYAKSLELRDKMAEETAKRAELLPAEEAALNEQEYWDAVAATDQPDLISALAKARSGVTARKRASIQRVNAAKDKAAEERALRQEAREALSRGDIDSYNEKKKAAETLRNTSVKEYVTEREADVDAELQAKRELIRTREQRGEAENILRELRRTPEMIDGKPNPKFESLASLYTLARGGAKAGQASLSYYENVWKESEDTLRKAQEEHSTYGTPETKAALEQARAARNRALQDYRSRAVGGAAPAAAQEMPSDFSQMTDEQILNMLGQ